MSNTADDCSLNAPQNKNKIMTYVDSSHSLIKQTLQATDVSFNQQG